MVNPLSISLVPTLFLLLGVLIYTRLLIVATLALKAAVRSTKVKLDGNSVCDLFIAHVIIGDAQTHIRRVVSTVGGGSPQTHQLSPLQILK